MRSLWLLLMVYAQWCMAQGVQRWSRTYDEASATELVGGICLFNDTSYRIATSWNGGAIGHLSPTAVNAAGDTIWRRPTINLSGTFEGGISHTVDRRDDGTCLWTGAVYPGGTSDPDPALFCFAEDGDSLWFRTYPSAAIDGFNAMCLVDDGGACLAGLWNSGQNEVFVVRVNSMGDTLWTRRHGGGAGQNAYSISRTLDSGFIIGGYRVLSGTNYDMYVLKLDSAGDLEWQRNHGSPWIDNAGFVEALPQGGYIMAGAERQTDASEKRPALYRLDDQGFEDWSVIYDDEPDRSVFFTVPVIMGDGGYAIAGDRNYGSQTRGMLMRTDSSGNMLWRRIYQTNTVIDHYFYDLRRTLDGGFIMAGTAFDSLLVSQDAWLVKTDSFGCLVPGCQVFDGLEEQITDLAGAISLSPNPADEVVEVTIALPLGTVRGNQLTLALVDAQGRLVHQEDLPALSPSHPITLTPLPAGLYFMHLLDGHRWLAGEKLVKR